MTQRQPPDEQPPDEQQRKRHRWRAHRDSVTADWPTVGGLTLVRSGFIGTFLVVFVWWVFHQQPQIEVPGLVGASHVAAVDQLKDKAPAAPPAPSQQTPVPNVVGYDLATAARMLRQNGLAIGSVTEEESNLTAAGDVLRTEPTIGTEVQPHSRVNLVVAKSKGPVLRRVPNVVGYHQATAARMLRQNGLAIGSVTEEESSQRATGDVLRTEPAASTEVPPHSRVNLVVAKSAIVR